ncbi:hypothetical protein ACE2AJ_12315 [Aquihabitans daechungensis]|uniref:hypothetical protein n=1 Tax=Aquihabitans daechungensis TaxID=1052257 RepID=UPI003B9E1962
MRRTSWRGAGLAIVVTAMALIASACQRTEVVLYDRTKTPNLAQRYVTRDGSDRYTLKLGPGAVRVDAPGTNVSTEYGSTTRSVIWPPSTRAVTDQQSCASWTDSRGANVQQGIALRVRIDGSRFRTIVVAKNIVYGANWQMNVYTWDSARSPYFKTHGAVSLRKPFELNDRPRPLPWKVCARVEGRVVRVKGWRSNQSEPGWTNPDHTGSVTLPPEWVYAGKAGWYAGHIPPGGTIGMGALRTSTWESQPDS